MEGIFYYTAFLVLILSTFAEYAKQRGNNKVLSDGTIAYRRNRIFVLLLIACLSLIAGFRYYVGTDYGYYYNSVAYDWQSFRNDFLSFEEPGLVLVAIIARSFYNHGIATIFLSALITITLYVTTIRKYSPLFVVSMMLYLFMGDWTGCFNGVRQYLASAILFAGHRFILQRKLLPYTIVVLAASLFHQSALMMILPYFLYQREPDIKQFLLLAFVAIVVAFSYNRIFSAASFLKDTEMTVDQYSYYSASVSVFRTLVAFIPVPVYFAFCKTKELTKEETLYINALFFNAFTMIAMSGSTYLARFGIYTQAMAIIGYAYMFNLFKDQKLKRLVIPITLLLFFVYYYIQNKDLEYRWWFAYQVRY